MAKLVLAEKYPKMVYGNLAFKTSVQDILGYDIEKDLGQSDWVTKILSEDQINYAVLDAVASLRLYKVLEGALARSKEIDAEIPMAWYSFNSKAGEAIHKKLSAEGKFPLSFQQSASLPYWDTIIP
ncbi:hypothetical protein C8R44DRAFT_731106 [Mycena epipterygia]|nr:hypothetical protein C8R44DRAFT_731102 [Mycena epipterygia]KAJ7132433.1 hypothetical protein C8R44DRAFT_731106 [Mycena epipterygia]